jgi:predicted MFS family arabinose efflux permease
MMYAAYYALTEPPEKALVVQLVPDEHRGQAFGWFHFVTGIAVLPASVLFGWLYEHFGAALAFQTGAVLAFIATIMLFIQPSGNREPH